MGKVEHTRLARGVRLTDYHIHRVLDAMATEINAADIELEQLEAQYAPFRVTIPLTHLDFDYATYPSGLGLDYESTHPWFVPFCLPPVQEYIDITVGIGDAEPMYTIGPNTPKVLLDEVSFSFDQRGEPCAIASAFLGSGAGDSASQGKMYFDVIDDAYNLRIAILEKPQRYFGDTEYAATREIFSADLPSDFFNGQDLRFNPFIIGDLNVTVNPYSTYVLCIYADGLDAASADRAALCSIVVSMRFLCELMPRDEQSGGILQNWPTTPHKTATDLSIDTQTVTINSPSPGDVISADDLSDGVAKNLHTLTDVFRQKLTGGMNQYGEVPPGQELAEDAGYEVLTFPLFQGRRTGGVNGGDAVAEPYIDAAAAVADNYLADRRRIPITYPFVVHHVILAWNWLPWSSSVLALGAAHTMPVASEFEMTVDVGIMTGVRGDNAQYEIIATTTMAGPDQTSTWDLNLIDYIRLNRNSIITTNNESRDWDLHQVPLVRAAPHVGDGYYDQGSPFYIGRTWTNNTYTVDGSGVQSVARSDCAAAGPGSPRTLGQEQAIEVRMTMRNNGGAHQLWAGPGPPDYRNNIYAGYGGHFVYVIGKKHLVGG